MNITGKIKVFKKDKGFYSTSINNKKQDGTYEYMYVSVQFHKGIEVENKSEINIISGFLSFNSYKTKNGEEKKELKIVVQDFTTKEEDAQELNNAIESYDYDGDGSSLPF